jgi:hypothetical protein
MTKRKIIEILMIIFFILSMVFAFWLINHDEKVKAFIAIGIIVGWFYAILMMEIYGVIQFRDSENSLREPKDQDIQKS